MKSSSWTNLFKLLSCSSKRNVHKSITYNRLKVLVMPEFRCKTNELVLIATSSEKNVIKFVLNFKIYEWNIGIISHFNFVA